MIEKLRWLAVTAALLGLAACGDGGSDDDSLLQLESDDVGAMSNNLGSSSQMTAIAMNEAMEGQGSAILAGEDPCFSSDFQVDGDNFTLDINMTDCVFEDPEYGTVTANGSFAMEGTYAPATDQIDLVLDACRPHIDGLDDLLPGLGELWGYVQMQAAYSFTDGTDDIILELEDGNFDLLAYAHGVVFGGTFKVPYKTKIGITVDAHVTAHLLLMVDLDATEDPDIGSVYGEVVVEFLRQETDIVLETLTITTDGSETATFTLDRAGRSGTIDLTTGTVTWDG
ncbi:MAG: hypothetical protein AB1486_02355 [Planctomycetota bacterium]